ncbi:MAG: DUF3987 domain-containing protein [SAR324 cluster bacterium]|nr:DUF3987 domain-containing protein [SAR324 cluster bacterium]
MTPEEVALALGGTPSSSGWQAHCPAHDDRAPSLSIGEGDDGKLLVHCHTGCGQNDVIKALRQQGLWPNSNGKVSNANKAPPPWERPVDAEYDYYDQTLNFLFQVVRFGDGLNPRFLQRQPGEIRDWKWNLKGIQPVIYHLPQILKSKEKRRTIFIAEGEKDVDAIRGALKLPATCNPGGAGNWKDTYTYSLAGAAQVVILPDNDGAGEKHAAQVANALCGEAESVKVIKLPGLPHKGDVFDWIADGGTREELEKLVEQTSEWILSLIDEQAAQVTNIIVQPEPLRRELPPPEQFPVDALGDVLSGMTLTMMDAIQAPDALCGQSVLAAAALAVQPHANIEIDGRIKPLSEYFVTVGKSGERKSSVDEVALGPHQKWQKSLIENHAQEKEDYAHALEESKKSGDSEKPTPPLEAIFISHEPTYEGLVKLFDKGQPSMGLFAHEGGRFIGGHGMKIENQLAMVSGLSEFWDGSPITRVRVKDGATYLFGRRLSMHLLIQPSVAQMFLGNHLNIDQGILSRCLTAWPVSTMGGRKYKPVNLFESPAVKRYFARMMELLEEPPLLSDGKKNELDPFSLTLNPMAKEVWVEFHNEVEAQLGEGQRYSQITGFASKAAEHAARVAGILTLVDDFNASQVDPLHMDAAVLLVRFYLSEAQRLFSFASTDPDILLAESLLEWAHGHDFIFPQLVYQLGPNRIREKKVAMRIIGILEDHRWLVRVEGGMELDGSHRRDVWRVIHAEPQGMAESRLRDTDDRE